MIKNILFDMGGVIFTQNTPRARERFRAAGVNPDIYMGDYGQKDFLFDLEAGKIDENQFIRRMAEVTGRPDLTRAEVQYCWDGFIEGVKPEKCQALEMLRKDYCLGMLSNTNPFVMEYMDNPANMPEGRGLSSYFDYMFLSYRMGLCKPSPEIYRMALKTGGMKADETIFIDDGPGNIEAAEKVGIHGLHIPTNADWLPLLLQMLGR